VGGCLWSPLAGRTNKKTLIVSIKAQQLWYHRWTHGKWNRRRPRRQRGGGNEEGATERGVSSPAAQSQLEEGKAARRGWGGGWRWGGGGSAGLDSLEPTFLTQKSPPGGGGLVATCFTSGLLDTIIMHRHAVACTFCTYVVLK
jgi:hypothetical protein